MPDPSPFDFDADDSDADDDRNSFDFSGRIKHRRAIRAADNSSMMGMLAIGVQLLAIASFAVLPWPVATLALLAAQLGSVVFVASSSRGRGVETAVWCLVVLCFPLAGTIAFSVSQAK